jgi:hypothetical protein
MSDVIDFVSRTTRPTRQQAQTPERVCADDECQAALLMRAFNAVLIDMESNNLFTLEQIRNVLARRLSYVDMKLAAKGIIL